MDAAETYLSQYEPPMRDLALQIRAFLQSVCPTLTEKVYTGYQMVSYGPSDKMNEDVAYIAVYKAHVNIGFMRGTLLPDPAGLLKGTGKTLRHVKIRSAADLEKHDKALRDLLNAALAERLN